MVQRQSYATVMVQRLSFIYYFFVKKKNLPSDQSRCSLTVYTQLTSRCQSNPLICRRFLFYFGVRVILCLQM